MLTLIAEQSVNPECEAKAAEKYEEAKNSGVLPSLSYQPHQQPSIMAMTKSASARYMVLFS